MSVVIRNRPELQGKPVAVCHSDNRRGTAEISSANYPARKHGLHFSVVIICVLFDSATHTVVLISCIASGVKAGMFVKDAKILCPQLVIVPYDFGAYEKV